MAKNSSKNNQILLWNLDHLNPNLNFYTPSDFLNKLENILNKSNSSGFKVKRPFSSLPASTPTVQKVKYKTSNNSSLLNKNYL